MIKLTLTVKLERRRLAEKKYNEKREDPPQPEGSESMVIHEPQPPLGVRPIGFGGELSGYKG